MTSRRLVGACDSAALDGFSRAVRISSGTPPAQRLFASKSVGGGRSSSSSRGGSSSSSSSAGRPDVAGKTSKSAQRLVKAQKQTLNGILASVHAAGPDKYVKNDHWAWYVWPTTKEGMSDPCNTAVKDAVDAAFVLKQPTAETWTALLEVLAAALRARGSRRVFPSIDHGRIDFFLKEWSEYRAILPSGFAAALDQFGQAWRDVR